MGWIVAALLEKYKLANPTTAAPKIDNRVIKSEGMKDDQLFTHVVA